MDGARITSTGPPAPFDVGLTPERARAWQRTLFHETRDAVLIVDPLDGTVVDANRAAASLVGRPRRELVGRPALAVGGPDDPEVAGAVIVDVRGPGAAPAAGTIVQDDGTAIPVRIVAGVIELDGRRVFQTLVRRLREDDDPAAALVPVPDDGSAALHRLGAILAGAPEGVMTAVLVGIAGFRGVNDLHGRVVGDLALAQIADRLQGVVDDLAPEGAVLRHHGAEFLVALPGSNAERGSEIATRAVERLRLPMHVGGRRLYLRATAGLAASPDDAVSADELVHAATLALDESLHDELPVTRASTSLLERREARLAIEERLPEALDSDGLHVAFQPLVDLGTRRVVSVETLARWDDPRLGVVSPGRFVPVATATGTIVTLGRVVLELALQQLTSWRAEGIGVPVAVNVSAEELRTPGFAEGVFARLERHGVPPTELELEISEETSVEHDARAIASLATLAAGGVRLALDDFGARFSSLATLRTIPLDHIKLDRDLVHRIIGSATDRAIVQAIVAIGDEVGARVTAEGIEDEEIVDSLLAIGVRSGQGFALGRPCPAAEVETRLRAGAGR